jgi:hypothetical protein
VAALISWLRGYHAGKTSVIPYQSPDPYGGRLGFYCKQLSWTPKMRQVVKVAPCP